MKKIILIIVLFFPIMVNARSVTVMDMDTNRVIYEENQKDVRLIASISKIMTTLVTLKNANIKDEITITDSVLKSYGSGIYVSVGEKISLENLLYGLMLRSGNDAAIQIAEYVAGSMEGFAELMNETAQSIGMKSTKFINSSGLEDSDGNGNMSTSYDMALLMSEAMKNKTFKTIVGTKEKTVKTNMKTYVWYNKNRLLKEYDYCTGGKTGFTEKARRTLVTTATKDNMNLVIVTLNDPNDFSNHKSLYEKYFKLYKSYKIIDKNKLDLGNKDYYIKEDVHLTLTKDEYKNIKTEVNLYEQNVSDVVGVYNIKLNNKIIKSEYIFKKQVKKQEPKEKNLFQKIIDFFKNL